MALPSSPTYISTTDQYTQNSTQSTFTVNFTWAVDATSTEYYFSSSSTTPDINTTVTMTTSSTSVTSFTYTLFIPNTPYFKWIRSRNDSGVSDWVTCGITITPPIAPVFSYASEDTTNIYIGFTFATGATKTDIYCSTSNSAPIQGTPATTYVTSGSVINVSGLSSSTLYYLWLRSENGYGVSYWSFATAVSTTTPNPRPSNFAWTYPKISGQSCIVGESEWNNFTSKINEFLLYKNGTSYSFTTVLTNMNFSAEIFNQARNAIYSMVATTVPIVSSDDSVFANYFSQLSNDLNSIL